MRQEANTAYSYGRTVYSVLVLLLSGGCVAATLTLLLAGSHAFSNFSHVISWAMVILMAPITFIAYLIGLRFMARSRVPQRVYMLGGLAGPLSALLLFLLMIVQQVVDNF